MPRTEGHEVAASDGPWSATAMRDNRGGRSFRRSGSLPVDVLPEARQGAAPPFPATDVRIVLAIFVGLRLVFLVVGLVQLGHGPVTDGYLIRYAELATEEGRPYRDYQVEYPPGQLALIRSLGDPDIGVTGQRTLVAGFVADIATALVLARVWGRTAAAWYLVLGAPLIAFSYGGFDLWSCLLAVASVASSKRGHGRVGGVLLACAILTRIWPVVLIPYFIVQRRWRSLSWTLGSLSVGVLAWIVAGGGVGAVRQVTTFRGATGWEFESAIGTLAWVAGSEPSQEAGAARFGTAPTWARVSLGVLALVISSYSWYRARRDPDRVGGPSVASVGGLLLASPLFSYPFVTWLVPWSALSAAEGEGRDLARLCGATCLLTVGAVLSFPSKEQLPVLTQGLLFARDGTLFLMVIVALRHLARSVVPPGTPTRPASGVSSMPE